MAFEHAMATLTGDLKDWYDSEYWEEDAYDSNFTRAVFDMSGRDGLLSPGDAIRVLNRSGITWEEYKEDSGSDSRHPGDICYFMGF